MNVPIWKTIGILGGMGPEATAEFYMRLVRICQKDYNAQEDSDFPLIYICNLPVPDMLGAEENGMPVADAVNNALNSLERLGCDFVSIPCNTIFSFISKTGKKSVINLIEETYLEAKRRGLKKVGLISSLNTAKSGIYEKAFSGIEVIQPPDAEKEQVNRIIWRILSGKKSGEDKKFLGETARRMAERGAEGVILGCTDIPLLVSREDFQVPVIDTLDVLAQATIKRAAGEAR